MDHQPNCSNNDNNNGLLMMNSSRYCRRLKSNRFSTTVASTLAAASSHPAISTNSAPISSTITTININNSVSNMSKRISSSSSPISSLNSSSFSSSSSSTMSMPYSSRRYPSGRCSSYSSSSLRKSKFSFSSSLSLSLSPSLLLLFICLLSCLMHDRLIVSTMPTSNSNSIHPFCQQKINVNQIYNIGNDIYLATNSRSIYRFDVDARRLYEQKYDIERLFGKGNFKWVDTVINLNGICDSIENLCPQMNQPIDSLGHRDQIERIHLVIGDRILHSTGDRVYGLALYEYLDDDELHKLKLLTKNDFNQDLLERLNRTGITINLKEQEGSIMMGSFWPSFNGVLSGNLYYRSGLFVPKYSDVFFSVYDNNDSRSSQRVIHRRLKSSKSTSTITSNFNDNKLDEWMNLNNNLNDGKFFIGMFNFRPKQRTFGLTKDNQINEFVWNQNDLNHIEFIPKGSIRQLLNCSGDSFELLNDSPTMKPDIPTTTTTNIMTTTTTTSMPSSSSSSSLFDKFPEFPQDKFKPKDTDTLEPNNNNNDDDNNNNNDDDDPNNNDDNEDDGSKEVPIPDEIDDIPNDLNNNNNHHHRQQHDDPTTLNDQQQQQQQQQYASTLVPKKNAAEAMEARGPFNPSDHGLVWTFAIIFGIIILLTLLICIPIFIIKHRSRKTKKVRINGNGTTAANGNGNNGNNGTGLNIRKPDRRNVPGNGSIIRKNNNGNNNINLIDHSINSESTRLMPDGSTNGSNSSYEKA